MIGIISDRIDQPDAANGFILDGFPRTVPQAEALDELLKKKHMKLDAVIELRVNESALLERVETRVAEMRERGEEVRVDDTPEVLTKRLASYRALTEPLIHYYSERRKLLTVDGMMTIEAVTREIDRILAAIGAVEAKAAKKPAAAKRTAKAAKPAGREGRQIGRQGRRKAAKAARKAAKSRRKGRQTGRQGGKKAARKAAAGFPGPRQPPRPGKPPKRSRKSELKHSRRLTKPS